MWTAETGTLRCAHPPSRSPGHGAPHPQRVSQAAPGLGSRPVSGSPRTPSLGGALLPVGLTPPGREAAHRQTGTSHAEGPTRAGDFSLPKHTRHRKCHSWPAARGLPGKILGKTWRPQRWRVSAPVALPCLPQRGTWEAGSQRALEEEGPTCRQHQHLRVGKGHRPPAGDCAGQHGGGPGKGRD